MHNFAMERVRSPSGVRAGCTVHRRGYVCGVRGLDWIGDLPTLPSLRVICWTWTSNVTFSFNPTMPVFVLNSLVPPNLSIPPPQQCLKPPHPGHGDLDPVSDPSILPRSVTLAPALLPPSTTVETIGHSALPSSLGESAPAGSVIASHAPRTCRLSAALQPSTPTAVASSAFPKSSPPPAPPQPSRSPLPSRGVVTTTPSWPSRRSASFHSTGSLSAPWAPPSSPSSALTCAHPR